MDDARLERIERRMDELDQRSSALERSVERAMDRSRAAMNSVLPSDTRRHMRAAWREVSPRMQAGHDVAWVARSTIRGARTQDLVAEMNELLTAAGVVLTLAATEIGFMQRWLGTTSLTGDQSVWSNSGWARAAL